MPRKLSEVKVVKEPMVHVNLRVPKETLEYYKQFENYTAEMRYALTQHAQSDTNGGG